MKEVSLIRDIHVKVMDTSKPWGYFDGSAQGDPPICGSGVYLYFSDTHYIHHKVGQEEGTNNYAEMTALKHLMQASIENGCRSLQIFGDSMNIINWENEIHRCHSLMLLSLLEEVLILKHHFDTFFITDVYRE